MLTTQTVIKNHVESILSWLQPLLPIANSHMVEYFSESIFKSLVPEDLRNEIISNGFDCSLDAIFNKAAVNMPNLNSYIQTAQSLYLCNLVNVCSSRQTLNEKLNEWGSDHTSSLKLQVFVTPKKSHEIEILSQIVASINVIKQTTHVIDVGGGKGYLGSLLALHHKIPVLSIDSSIVNTHGAIKRLRLLERAWNDLPNKPNQSVPLNKSETVKTTPLYKQVTKFVTEDTNFEELITDAFSKKSCNFGLAGLHTCGDLGSSCIRIFNKNNHIKTLCNVACCYHLLSEEFEDDKCSSSTNFGFPLSAFLRNKKFALGRNARMLSAQPIDRILLKKELPKNTILYRAILQILLDQYGVHKDHRTVGRTKKECKDFVEYCYNSLKNINANFEVPQLEIEELFDKYKEHEKELHVFYMLRCMLAPVIESLILLDRLLFLHENGHNGAFLVHLFDTIVSPRCYGLIAFKE